MNGFFYGPIFYIPVSVLMLMGFGIFGLRRKLPLSYYFCAVLGIVYANFAISFAFFPITFLDLEGFFIENNISWSIVNSTQGFKHIALNMILTIPLGIGMQFVTNLTNKTRLIIIILLSALFELLQLIIIYIFKPIDVFFDINDLLANIIGGIAGFTLAHFLNCMYKKERPENAKSLYKYIRYVCHNCANGKKSLELNKIFTLF